jgi:hypothetical protein
MAVAGGPTLIRRGQSALAARISCRSARILVTRIGIAISLHRSAVGSK